MAFERASGILLHPTSLPSTFGIGDLGKNAYHFVDFLARSGQKLWQILPLGPTGYEHSPYTMNYSAFAGNPLMISLEKLAAEGLLNPPDLIPLQVETPERINFDRVIPYKYGFLQQAYQKFQQQLSQQENPEFTAFCQTQASWLEDYVLFMALLDDNGGQAWNHWPEALARRHPEALDREKERLRDLILYHQFLQFKFFEQWQSLRQYTNKNGIKIIGDVSIYVCHNSADVWANQDIFKLQPDSLEPAWMAGVPPDYFSATGQLWGNPVYDWDRLKETNYAWWIERFRATLQYVDVVRIDHFRGFEAYWQVPAGEETAMHGEWVKAPGLEFFETLGRTLGELPVLAEDLGIITPEVEELRDHFGFPGMKILLFAFGSGAENPYLPHHYSQNAVVYTGTHDNDTTVGWWENASVEQKDHVAEYLGYDRPQAIANIAWALIRLALSSVANWAILPLQDLLSLDNRSRMNDPSVSAGNWRWRYPEPDILTNELGDRLLRLTQCYDR